MLQRVTNLFTTNIFQNNEITNQDINDIIDQNIQCESEGPENIKLDNLNSETTETSETSKIINSKTNECNHDWVDYDEKRLDNMDIISEVKRETNLLRILIKSLERKLSELDNKMLNLLVTWISPPPKIYGICLVCGDKIVVVQLDKNLKYIMYGSVEN